MIVCPRQENKDRLFDETLLIRQRALSLKGTWVFWCAFVRWGTGPALPSCFCVKGGGFPTRGGGWRTGSLLAQRLLTGSQDPACLLELRESARLSTDFALRPAPRQ